MRVHTGIGALWHASIQLQIVLGALGALEASPLGHGACDALAEAIDQAYHDSTRMMDVRHNVGAEWKNKEVGSIEHNMRQGGD